MSELSVPKNWKFCNYDADGMGRKIGRAVLANDLDDIRHQSNLIAAGHDLVKRWVRDRDGIWIMGGGDEGAFAIDPECFDGLEGLRKDYEYLVGATISIGVGRTPAEAGKALLMAKIKGKNRIIEFTRKAAAEIASIKKRAKKGIFRSVEEHKLADAYLNKNEPFGKPDAVSHDCEWCNQTDGIDPEHCTYCHDAEVEEGGEECPYCKQAGYDNPAATTRMDMPELAEQDCEFCKEMDEKGKEECPYCKEEGIAPNAMNPGPDSNNDQPPAGSDEETEMYAKAGMNPPILGKPDPSKEPPIGQNPPMDTIPKDAPKDAASADQSSTLSNEDENPGPEGKEEPRLNVEQRIDPEDNHSKEALQSIAEQIEAEGKPAQSEVNAVDDAEIPSGMAAEGNVSRHNDYDQNVPGDMGMGGPNPPADDVNEHNEPDFSSILEEGLDHNADEIGKQKAIQTVSQALSEFKMCKDQLESIKMQMPQLYKASISMLRAMIDMASLMGLGQPGELGQNMPQSGQNPEELGQDESQLGQVQADLMPEEAQTEEPGQENEWNDPFPLHPDNGGERKPGHSPSSTGGPPSPQR